MVRMVAVAAFLLILLGCGRLNEETDQGPGELSSSTVSSDGTAPTVAAVSPSFNQVDLGSFKVFTITFSEPMDSTSISFQNNGRGCGQAIRVQWIGASACEVIDTVASSDGKAFTFTLSESLGNTLTYTLTVTTDVTDQAGNALAFDYGGTWEIAGSGAN